MGRISADRWIVLNTRRPVRVGPASDLLFDHLAGSL
jgi:hypothetical protein